MSTKDKLVRSQLDRKMPPILWNQMKKAILLCEYEGLTFDQMFELLKIYRKNYAKFIAKNGLTYFGVNKPLYSYEDFEIVKPELSIAIQKLDEAFQEINKYLQYENVDEFIAKAIVEKITTLKQSKIA
jgi:hypothetical protein